MHWKHFVPSATDKKLRVTLFEIGEEEWAAETVPGAPAVPSNVPEGEEGMVT